MGVTLVITSCRNEVPAQDDHGQIMSFDSARVRLIGKRADLDLVVELAVSHEQKTMGLMERRQLPEMSGMLFIYASIQPESAGFWMYRTRIPLDIAFLDANGVIRSIRSMPPCETTIPQGCPTYSPGVPYQYALEVNHGFFARHAISIGDTVTLPGLPKSVPASDSARSDSDLNSRDDG